MKKYKVLTQEDSFFSNELNPEKLEQAINACAEQGWRVVSCTINNLGSGVGSNRELIIILERDE